MGPTWVPDARKIAPKSIRAIYGTPNCGTNAEHGAKF